MTNSEMPAPTPPRQDKTGLAANSDGLSSSTREERQHEDERKGAGHRTRSRYSQVNNGSPQSGESSSPEGQEKNRLQPGIASQTGIDRVFGERQALESALQGQSEYWREEVANRVEGYRTRRSRKRLAGQFSMRLDFDVPRARSAAWEDEVTRNASPLDTPPLPPKSAADSSTTAAAPLARPHVEAADMGYELTGPKAAARSDSTLDHGSLPLSATEHVYIAVQETRIIEFPRFAVFPEFEPDPRALAEPVFDRPRILDVPEEVGTAEAPPLADIALPPAGLDEEQAPPPELELPLHVAPLARRCTAALIDLLLVTVATGIFGMIVASSSLDLAPGKPWLALGLAAPVFFWCVYHYLFLVNVATTPGMLLAGVRMRTFQNDSVCRSLRRWRALAMALSLVSLGFGFLWALIDSDTLCWHDKMTGTYLTLPER
jgi:uncharacterized RDD family membrane protein YckC